MTDTDKNDRSLHLASSVPVVRERNPNREEVIASILKHEAEALARNDTFMLELAAESRKEYGMPPRNNP